ncbi:MAG: LPS-assembly protein LptD [Acidobacteria bacterium]|nr:LPS-assembly protein LptD [Acidobacteriota bacterium]
MRAQEVTATAPSGPAAVDDRPAGLDGPASLPDDPSISRYPDAVLAAPEGGRRVTIDAAVQKKIGDLYSLEGDVQIVSKQYTVHADRMEYNAATGDVKAEGHLRMTGGEQLQTISADRGEFNLRTQQGRFYNVRGSVGFRGTPAQRPNVYTTGDPFLFSGRMVVKTGPDSFEIYDGTVTSCQMPRPDWELRAAHFTVRDGKATARNTQFRVLDVPVIFLPYASHPVDIDTRQSGFMVPVIGQSTFKGSIVGEQFYLAINRSMDLLVGAEYFSKRGWEQNALFRYRGRGLDFATARYTGVLDRLPAERNQGGEEFALSARKDINDHTRAVADVNYLSSFVYREAFNENFNQAVVSDITSSAFLQRDGNGYVGAIHADRYQGLKNVSTSQEVRIFHAPSIDFDVMEKPLGKSPLVWSAQNSVAVLKRVQRGGANFSTEINTRVDVQPRISLPLSAKGWTFRPGFAVRDTFYTHHRKPGPLPGTVPVEVYSSINRAVIDANFEMRAPVLERVFDTGVFRRFLGRKVKHTIEPQLRYTYRTGVDEFNKYLRFDETDVVSNTNEVEYGITQRLFLRPTKERDCREDETPSEEGAKCGGTRESLLWRVVQKRFFDPRFGGALNPGRRNVLQTTLDFSGVAFLTEPRDVSPILSQMRLSASERLDLEWDMNYDTHAGKFTQSNVFLNYHMGKYFGGLSHARLNAPGRAQSGSVISTTSNFSQLKFLAGYGDTLKPGFSLATTAGLNLSTRGATPAADQPLSLLYEAIQTGYNWRCCGLSMEYRRYELGTIRPAENAYKFNLTLANIASVGNLRRIDKIF